MFFTGLCENLLPHPSSMISKKSLSIRRGFYGQFIKEAAYFVASSAAASTFSVAFSETFFMCFLATEAVYTSTTGFVAVALSRAKETTLIINAASNPNVSFLFIFIYCCLHENEDSFLFSLIVRADGGVSFRKSCRFAAIVC
jgi:hypothetical protein